MTDSSSFNSHSASNSDPLQDADLLSLSDEMQDLTRWLRQQRTASLTEIAAYLGQDEATARSHLESLLQSGLIAPVPAADETEPTRYRPRLQRRQRRPLNDQIWQRLDESNQP